MTLSESREFANLRVQLAQALYELRLTKAKVKLATTCGYNRALRRLARNPTGALLTATYRQGKAMRAWRKA